MTGPPDERAAAAGSLRASHVDREQAISALKAAFVQGRLTSDEFDARVGQALASRTRAELAAITADIPVGAAAWSAGSAAAGAAALAVSGVVIFTLFVTGYQVRESTLPWLSLVRVTRLPSEAWTWLRNPAAS